MHSYVAVRTNSAAFLWKTLCHTCPLKSKSGIYTILQTRGRGGREREREREREGEREIVKGCVKWSTSQACCVRTHVCIYVCSCVCSLSHCTCTSNFQTFSRVLRPTTYQYAVYSSVQCTCTVNGSHVLCIHTFVHTCIHACTHAYVYLIMGYLRE